MVDARATHCELDIQRLAVRWNRPLADWPAALSQFVLMFPGRVTM